MDYSVPSLEKKQLLSGVDEFFLPLYDDLLNTVIPNSPYPIQEVIKGLRTVNNDLSGPLRSLDYTDGSGAWYRSLQEVCSCLYTFLMRESNKVVMAETLKVVSIIVGSWIIKNLDIMSGQRGTPYFNKNLVFYTKSDRAVTDFMEKLYLYIRLTRCRFPTDIMREGAIFHPVPEMHQAIDEWPNNMLWCLNARKLDRAQVQAFLRNASKQFLFVDKYPIMMMGHVSQVPSESQRHQFAAEFIV